MLTYHQALNGSAIGIVQTVSKPVHFDCQPSIRYAGRLPKFIAELQTCSPKLRLRQRKSIGAVSDVGPQRLNVAADMLRGRSGRWCLGTGPDESGLGLPRQTSRDCYR